MRTNERLLLVLGATLLSSSCFSGRNCDEIRPNRVEGSYVQQPSFSWHVGGSATLQASPETVELSYKRADGVRVRAVYRVTRKATR